MTNTNVARMPYPAWYKKSEASSLSTHCSGRRFRENVVAFYHSFHCFCSNYRVFGSVTICTSILSSTTVSIRNTATVGNSLKYFGLKSISAFRHSEALCWITSPSLCSRTTRNSRSFVNIQVAPMRALFTFFRAVYKIFHIALCVWSSLNIVVLLLCF